MTATEIPFTYHYTEKTVLCTAEVMRSLGRVEERLRGKRISELCRRDNLTSIISSSLIFAKRQPIELDAIKERLNYETELISRNDYYIRNTLKAYDLQIKEINVASLQKIHEILLDTFTGGGALKNISAEDLGSFLDQFDNIQAHRLILAAVLHYNLACLGPFAERNKQLALLLHKKLLIGYSFAFQDVPFESVLAGRKEEYLRLLGAGSLTAFVDFTLEVLQESLLQFEKILVVQPSGPADRLSWAKSKLRGTEFLTEEYIEVQRGLSESTARKDLSHGVKTGDLSSKTIGSSKVFKFA